MSGGRLIRVGGYRGDVRSATYIVAVAEGEKAIELIRNSVAKIGDDVTDLGRVSAALLKALAIEPGDFRSIDEPTISQQQEQPQSVT